MPGIVGVGKTHSSLRAGIRSTRHLLSKCYVLSAVRDTGDKCNEQNALRTVKRDKASNYQRAEHYEELTLEKATEQWRPTQLPLANCEGSTATCG